MQNTNQQNDLSLLRPFNLEAAKSGEEIQWSAIDDAVTFVGVANNGLIAYDSDGETGFTSSNSFRMKPLCWVEGKPVYKGDVLYWTDKTTHKGAKFIVSGTMICENTLVAGCTYLEGNLIYDGSDGSCGMMLYNLTWNKPKQKVKRKVWINVYPENLTTCYYSREAADDCAYSTRIACVETEIEYEV